jgi:hypothetical protein
VRHQIATVLTVAITVVVLAAAVAWAAFVSG